MATILLVVDRPAGEPVVGPDVAERLATLGISRITVLRDPSSTAVILEGWAFDPARTNEATGALFPTGGANLRRYHEVQYVGVSSIGAFVGVAPNTPAAEDPSAVATFPR